MSIEIENSESGAIASGNTKIWTVVELTRAIRGLLEESFYPFWLTGEIGNLTIHRSGHVYFTLKDPYSQINAVFFGGADVAKQLKIQEGTELEVFGKLMVYEPRGVYQLNVKMMRAKGLGALQLQLEQLKQKLLAEGLFDEKRKKKIPFLPQCIGIVTSTDGAALRDFLNVTNRRFSEMHIRIYPATVQGPSAAREITDGVHFFNRTRGCDVIVLTRGGGSLEDLWPFNDEILARTIAKSDIPIISAVGHEVDFTIGDFVADLRVPTPSAAAELVVNRKDELNETVVNLKKRMITSIKLHLSQTRARVERLANHYILKEPINIIRTFQQKVDELGLRLNRSINNTLQERRYQIDNVQSRLRALNPKNVLERGYSILLSKSTQKPILSPQQVDEGERLRGIIAQGELELIVGSNTPE